MFQRIQLQSELMQKAKELATESHPTGLRKMADDLRKKDMGIFADVYAQLAETVESVLAGREIPTRILPTCLSIEGIVEASPQGGSISAIVYAQECVRTYAQLTYGQYLMG